MQYKIIFSIVFLLFINQSSAWVSVGSSPGFGFCDYSTIQAALDSNEGEIRVLTDNSFLQDFEENLVVDYSVDIRGGYNTCLSASLNQVTNTNTIIKGSANLGSPVIEIASTNSPHIRLYNLTLRDAVDTIFVNGGHGLDIGNSDGLVEIIDSLIVSNTAENGGGIFIKNTNGNLSVVITDSSVFGNTASGQGGGIYCSENSFGTSNITINVRGSSLIGENSAEDGGGIAAFKGCTVTVDSGTDLSPNSELRGIIANTATQYGGGVYLNFGTLRLQGNKYALGVLGNNTDPVTLANNTATSRGGGVYAIHGSTIEITDGLITNNSSTNDQGGGFFLGTSSGSPVSLTMQPSDGPCWNSAKCSVLSNNRSSNGYGGGLYMEASSTASIYNTFIHGNRADFGTVAYVSDNNATGTTLNIEGSYIYENGNDGDSINDKFVIRANGDVIVKLIHDTFADNDVNDTGAIIAGNNADITIKNSLLDNFPETILEQSGTNSTHISCTVASDLSSLDFFVFPTSFVDSSNDDYHLASNSQAIDACATTATILDVDTDNQTRGWDDDTRGNFNGIYDAGADESYTNDIIFKNGFE